MLQEWFLISSTTLIVTALFCAGLMWTMHGHSRPKGVLAIVSTLLFAYMSTVLVVFYMDADFQPEKLVYSYSLICIATEVLIYIYFRLLMQPWESNRKLIGWLAGGLAAFVLLYIVIAPFCSEPRPIYTFADIFENISHPLVLLRVTAFLVFVVVLIAVVIKTWSMYKRHKDVIAAQFSFRENISLSWIPYLIFLYTLYGGWTIFDQFISGNVGWVFVASNFIYAVFYLVINFLGLRQQDIYTKAETDRNRTEQNVPTGNGNGNGIGMSLEIRTKLRNDLINLMETEHEFRNPELRLDNVVRALNTNRTYLSTIIREDFGGNFLGFVNSYRIGEAKELLTNGSTSLTITEIAERVGFKSISSFNTFFKRETDMSPTQYRKVHTLKQC